MPLKVTKYAPDSCISPRGLAAATIGEGVFAAIDTDGTVIVATNAAAGVKKAVGFNPVGSKASGDKVALATCGIIDGFSGLTIGEVVYLTTAGGVTQTRPATTNQLIQELGHAISATAIFANVKPSGLLSA